jgi:hypothetical protein
MLDPNDEFRQAEGRQHSLTALRGRAPSENNDANLSIAQVGI